MSDWKAIVVDGRERDLRPFVAGFAGDRGIDPAAVVLGVDVGLEPGSIGSWLLDLIGKGHHVVLAQAAVGDALVQAIEQVGGEVDLRVERSHPVSGARFLFRVETFSRDVAAAARAALADVPHGVRVEDRQESERSTPDGHGVELYAPVHSYAYTLAARVSGPLTGVLEVRRRLSDIESAALEPLHVIDAPA